MTKTAISTQLRRSSSLAGWVKVIFKSEYQFPSLKCATSQLSQSQFGALHLRSIQVPFSEMWSDLMLLEMSNLWGMSLICWFIQSVVIRNGSSTQKMDISTHIFFLRYVHWWKVALDITIHVWHSMSIVTVTCLNVQACYCEYIPKICFQSLCTPVGSLLRFTGNTIQALLRFKWSTCAHTNTITP